MPARGIVALAIGVGFVALACRAHVGTAASATRDDHAGGELTRGLSGVDAGPPDPAEAVGGDGDGIPDSKDVCPSEPEDLDNFEDQDGCPDPDNDRDGISDVKDKCPNEPETYNGVQDDDGCPDRSGVPSCGNGEACGATSPTARSTGTASTCASWVVRNTTPTIPIRRLPQRISLRHLPQIGLASSCSKGGARWRARRG